MKIRKSTLTLILFFIVLIIALKIINIVEQL
jgi:preprotein translocase subunit SecG